MYGKFGLHYLLHLNCGILFISFDPLKEPSTIFFKNKFVVFIQIAHVYCEIAITNVIKRIKGLN